MKKLTKGQKKNIIENAKHFVCARLILMFKLF